MTLPAAVPGPAGPLPPLRPLDEMHTIDDRVLSRFPRDMARQLRYAPLHSLLPVHVIDGYDRSRTPTDLPAVVLENDRLRATVLPGLGGRIHSLVHRPTGRELLYRNPVLQPADFALNGAWFSGGIEWNIGATGHTTLSVAPLHAARVPAPDGGEMLRLWEWERLRDLPFQVDLWLPDDSDFLYVGVRIRNPHEHPSPTYWWSNIAVPEEHRVLAPADESWLFSYERTLRRVPVPHPGGPGSADCSYPLNSDYPADFFYEVPDGQRRWITALDDDGHGLVQTSTDLLRGRKLFVWGAGPGGRRWQQWLTEPGTGGYSEIQAGLVRTQLEHVRMEPASELSWLEAYGPLGTDPAAVHGTDWAAARAEVEQQLAAALPRADVDAAYRAWRTCADTEPGERLATGSGWGALEVLRGRWKLPGTPFGEDTLGPEQEPWRRLMETGAFAETEPELDAAAASGRGAGPGGAPAHGAAAAPHSGTLVSRHWRDMLETAPATPLTEYHLGVAQWHTGDRAQAVRSWERGLTAAAVRWPLLRCLAVADASSDHPQRAADRYEEAFDDLCARSAQSTAGVAGAGAAGSGDAVGSEDAVGGAGSAGSGAHGAGHGGTPANGDTPAMAALGREALGALLTAGRTARARAVWERLGAGTRARGRFRLIEAELLLAEGRPEAARAVFDAGFEVADLREGDEVIGEVWRRITDEPLPQEYDFRMRPGTE